MSTIQKARKLAANMGAEIEYDRSCGRLNATIGGGLVFSASGCHDICHDFERGPWAKDQIEAMIEDLLEGATRCTDDDCDFCICEREDNE